MRVLLRLAPWLAGAFAILGVLFLASIVLPSLADPRIVDGLKTALWVALGAVLIIVAVKWVFGPAGLFQAISRGLGSTFATFFSSDRVPLLLKMTVAIAFLCGLLMIGGITGPLSTKLGCMISPHPTGGYGQCIALSNANTQEQLKARSDFVRAQAVANAAANARPPEATATAKPIRKTAELHPGQTIRLEFPPGHTNVKFEPGNCPAVTLAVEQGKLMVTAPQGCNKPYTVWTD